MNQPLVSILMTAFNRQQFIGEAIESVLASTYQNWELIIVDDCSKDTTVEIAKSFAVKEPRIRLYLNEKNIGDYPNRNCAASYAKGIYLVNVDSDDTMFPNVLEEWIYLMQIHKTKFGIFTNVEEKQALVLRPEETLRRHFFEKPILSFGPVATIVERMYFFEQKGFPHKYGPANDMYQNLKLASHTNTLLLNFPLVNYRVHEGQELNNPYGYLFNNYNYLKDALDEIDLPLTVNQVKFLSDKNKRRFLMNALQYLFKTGDIKKTIRAFQFTGFSVKDFTKALIH